jgi:hypothetical protein
MPYTTIDALRDLASFIGSWGVIIGLVGMIYCVLRELGKID